MSATGPAQGQHFQIKFFAFDPGISLVMYEEKGARVISQNQHFFILFERRGEYENRIAYSPEQAQPNSGPAFDTEKAFILDFARHAHTFSTSEALYDSLLKSIDKRYCLSLEECLRCAGEILKAIGKNAPVIPDSGITAVEYLRVLIRANTPNYQAFTDERDGKIYNTIKIGNRTWMAENLCFRTDHPENTYNPKSETYGCLYDFPTARNVCPKGWHLPSKADWDSLVAQAGGPELAGNRLKAKDFWEYHRMEISDSLGFRVLPAGYRTNFLNMATSFWAFTEDIPKWIGVMTLIFYRKEVLFHQIPGEEEQKQHYSVRCIKDE